jgi:hypothetical protein
MAYLRTIILLMCAWISFTGLHVLAAQGRVYRPEGSGFDADFASGDGSDAEDFFAEDKKETAPIDEHFGREGVVHPKSEPPPKIEPPPFGGRLPNNVDTELSGYPPRRTEGTHPPRKDDSWEEDTFEEESGDDEFIDNNGGGFVDREKDRHRDKDREEEVDRSFEVSITRRPIFVPRTSSDDFVLVDRATTLPPRDWRTSSDVVIHPDDISRGDGDGWNSNSDLSRTKEYRGQSSFFHIFSDPLVLAGIIGGAVLALLCIVLLVMFMIYRMRKKDEGSYALGEPKRTYDIKYTRTKDQEFFA